MNKCVKIGDVCSICAMIPINISSKVFSSLLSVLFFSLKRLNISFIWNDVIGDVESDIVHTLFGTFYVSIVFFFCADNTHRLSRQRCENKNSCYLILWTEYYRNWVFDRFEFLSEFRFCLLRNEVTEHGSNSKWKRHDWLFAFKGTRRMFVEWINR